MKLTLLSADDVRQALPMREAIEAMKGAFADYSSGRATVPQRMSVGVPESGGTVLLKPALTPTGVGAKLVSFFPGNRARGKPVVTGIVVLLDRESGEPQALLDGTFVTAWRTGAASGAATDLLASKGVGTAALLGCGAQAETQALAIDTARRLETIRIYARTPAAVERFIAAMQPRLKARLVAAPSSDDAIDGAGLICAATTSSTPVFDGRKLSAGVHVNGIGSFTKEMQEVDLATVERSRIFVDSRESAAAEAGELVVAIRAGRTRPEDWTELGEVVEGSRPGRASDSELTFFKSVGLAVQDVAACARVLDNARNLGLGSVVEL